MTSSRWFWRGAKYQVNITRYWAGLGVRTWPPTHTGIQKRAVHFGAGYLSWRIDGG